MIRIALSSSSPSNAAVYIADGLGYMQKQGIQLKYFNFNSASEIAPALMNNQVDVADVGINPAMFNTLTAGLGTKLVVDKGSSPKGFGFTALVVRKDLAGKIKGPADLKGINLAMTPPGLGTANGFALSVYLAKAQLTPQDLHIQPLAFAAQPAALSNKAVDAAIMAEPFITQVAKNGIGVRLVGLDEVVPNQQIAGLAFSSQFISQHKDLGQKFAVAYVQAVRYYNNAFVKGINKDKVIDILASKTAVKDKQLWAEMVPAGLNPDGKLNKDSIQSAEQFFYKLGLIKSAPPLSSFVDDSFVEYADKQLGPSS
ncbi:MAG: ABC transporter substrate-binding protein [Chloroflexota bacterium]|nr:ABC transporter substrate-binding protein [Chloroflexota bacterium]